MKNWIIAAALFAFSVAGFVTFQILASPSGDKQIVTVYKSPTCGCCTKWEDHLRQAGFEVFSKPIENTNSAKAIHGVPDALWSCHTALVEGLVVEGHVPASSIKKLLAERPVGVKGISVPGMPIGSPGMEGPNPERYEVISFSNSGTTQVFDRH